MTDRPHHCTFLQRLQISHWLTFLTSSARWSGSDFMIWSNSANWWDEEEEEEVKVEEETEEVVEEVKEETEVEEETEEKELEEVEEEKVREACPERLETPTHRV